MACNLHIWTTHTDEQHRTWHAIITFVQHTWSDNVRRGMPAWSLGSTHGQTKLGMTCHNHPWEARSDNVGRGMPSLPLERIHDRTTSGVKCYHRRWKAHTIDHIRCGMTACLLISTHHQMMSGLASHYRPCAAHTVGHHQASHVIIALGSTQMIVGHRALHVSSLWITQTDERHQAWHAIIGF